MTRTGDTAVVGVLAVFTLGLAAGAMLTEGALLVPQWRALPPPAFLEWYAANAELLLRFFAPLETAAAVLAVAAAALHVRWRQRGWVWFVAAATLALAVLGTFPLYFRDVNASFAAATIAPDRVADELARWAAWHWSRTAIGIAAFAAAAIGSMTRSSRSSS